MSLRKAREVERAVAGESARMVAETTLADLLMATLNPLGPPSLSGARTAASDLATASSLHRTPRDAEALKM